MWAVKASDFSNFLTLPGVLSVLSKLYFSPSLIEYKLMLVQIALEYHLEPGCKGKLEKLLELPYKLPVQQD